MTKTELSKILFALKTVFGEKDGYELFEKLIKFIYS